MLCSVHFVQPSKSFAITQARRLCVEKVIFPLPSPFSPLDSPFWSLPSPKKENSTGNPCVERVNLESEAHLAICEKPIWRLVWSPSGDL